MRSHTCHIAYAVIAIAIVIAIEWSSVIAYHADQVEVATAYDADQVEVATA